MKATLNKIQLTHISKFIKARGVNYTDVNAEMTDHIASEVEELMELEDISFLVAVKQVFLRYKRFHFMNIEEAQVEKLQKQSWKSFKNGFVYFFSFPKIIFTICLFFSFYRIAEFGYSEYLGYSYVLLAIFLGGFLFYLKRKRLGKGTYLQLSKFHWIFTLIINIGVQVMFSLDRLNDYISSWGACAFSTVMFLILFIAIELYVKEFRKIKKQYA
jgi:hypothetical protein